MESTIGSRVRTILKLLFVAFFLYLFLISIGLMGEAFKGFGKGFAEALLNSTANPFIGLFIGIIATSLIQSSSTTTSILVGMVASGAMTIENAVPMIMGANIGTTVTNMIVSLGHITRREEFKRAIAGASVHDFFNIICVSIFFPLELMTGFLQKLATFLASVFENAGGIKFISPIKLVTAPLIKTIKHFLVETLPFEHGVGYVLILVLSAVLLFVSLYFIVKLMRSLVIKRTEIILNNVLGKTGLVGIAAGLVFTAVVQSSSITTSLLVPMIGAGILTVELAFPITIGANIGTTTTAILASFATGNIAAITIAFVHFLFNVSGLLLLYPIKIFRTLPIYMAKALGELAFYKRRYALIFMVSIFFVIPGLFILLSNLFR
jgi:solute carrier family 34 (sodium-dependent phosphate cotransporter)